MSVPHGRRRFLAAAAAGLTTALASPWGVWAGHDPPRPTVSYGCSRLALVYVEAVDGWFCAADRSRLEILNDRRFRSNQLSAEQRRQQIDIAEELRQKAYKERNYRFQVEQQQRLLELQQ